MNDTLRPDVAAIGEALSRWPEVTALALGGSRAAGLADAASDIDLYAYVSPEVPVSERSALVRERGRSIELDNRFWELGDEWEDVVAGVRIDVIYRSPVWAEAELAAVLDRHEARLGYTTCVWHNIRTSRMLFDRSGWFAGLQRRAGQAYPDELVRAIVARNQPVLRSINSSYRSQILVAAERRDLVAINHRIAAFLASYFDILFAINRATHPGEKRLLQAATGLSCVPPSCADDVGRLLSAAASPEPELLGSAVDALCDGLDGCVRRSLR